MGSEVLGFKFLVSSFRELSGNLEMNRHFQISRKSRET